MLILAQFVRLFFSLNSFRQEALIKKFRLLQLGLISYTIHRLHQINEIVISHIFWVIRLKNEEYKIFINTNKPQLIVIMTFTLSYNSTFFLKPIN
jgi:hypothetical protein